MKKIALFATVALYCCISNLSCNSFCNVDVDPAPVPVCFIVTDIDGNNLLDPAFTGNILGNKIEITYNQQKYPLVLEEYDYSIGGMGLHTGKVGGNVPGIMFCYFYAGRDSGGGEFIIDWGDGTSGHVKFDLYYNVVWCEPVSHMKIYYNGEAKSNNSLTITLVK